MTRDVRFWMTEASTPSVLIDCHLWDCLVASLFPTPAAIGGSDSSILVMRFMSFCVALSCRLLQPVCQKTHTSLGGDFPGHHPIAHSTVFGTMCLDHTRKSPRRGEGGLRFHFSSLHYDHLAGLRIKGLRLREGWTGSTHACFQ